MEKERKERNREGAEETGPLKKLLKSLGSMQPVAYFCESHLMLLQEFLCRISGPNLWSLGTTRVLCLYLDESHKTHTADSGAGEDNNLWNGEWAGGNGPPWGLTRPSVRGVWSGPAAL